MHTTSIDYNTHILHPDTLLPARPKSAIYIRTSRAVTKARFVRVSGAGYEVRARIAIKVACRIGLTMRVAYLSNVTWIQQSASLLVGKNVVVTISSSAGTCPFAASAAFSAAAVINFTSALSCSSFGAGVRVE